MQIVRLLLLSLLKQNIDNICIQTHCWMHSKGIIMILTHGLPEVVRKLISTKKCQKEPQHHIY